VEVFSVNHNLQQNTQTTLLVYWFVKYYVYIFLCSLLWLSSTFRFFTRFGISWL